MIDVGRFKRKGKILMLALDHRGSFKKLFNTASLESIGPQIISVKKMLSEALYDEYSGILLDPEYGLKAYTKDRPFLLSIEKSGYDAVGEDKPCKLENSVADLKKMGAKGVKILIFLNPASKTFSDKLILLKKLNDECHALGLPFFLEFLTYPVNGSEYVLDKAILETLDHILDNGIFADVFKLEYPGNAAACRAISSKLKNNPWILLTKGVGYETFKNSLAAATAEGASGFLAGRSLWQDFVDFPENEWQGFFSKTVKNRFKEVSAVALS